MSTNFDDLARDFDAEWHIARGGGNSGYREATRALAALLSQVAEEARRPLVPPEPSAIMTAPDGSLLVEWDGPPFVQWRFLAGLLTRLTLADGKVVSRLEYAVVPMDENGEPAAPTGKGADR